MCSSANGRLAADIDLLDKRMVEIVASDTVLAHRCRESDRYWPVR
jgi:hypothetical protein